MYVPAIRGMIDRRILVNFHIDPEVMARLLPAPFRPKKVRGHGIGGICLIRLKGIRPAWLPGPIGLNSENAAHRFAVEWDDPHEPGNTREGVYIPRRDSNSRMNTCLGGRLFPGVQHHARFDVAESDDRWSVSLASDDGVTRLRVVGTIASGLPATSVFKSIEEASEFFQRGGLGYSDTRRSDRLDGMELCCKHWDVEPMQVEEVKSSFFQDEQRFPSGSVDFDCALLMRSIEHVWRHRDEICCGSTAG